MSASLPVLLQQVIQGESNNFKTSGHGVIKSRAASEMEATPPIDLLIKRPWVFCQINDHIWLVEPDITYNDIRLPFKRTGRGQRRDGGQGEVDEMFPRFTWGWKQENEFNFRESSSIWRRKSLKTRPCSVLTSVAQRVADTRQHEMCYWSERPFDCSRWIHSWTGQVRRTNNAAWQRIMAWKWALGLSFFMLSCHVHRTVGERRDSSFWSSYVSI